MTWLYPSALGIAALGAAAAVALHFISRRRPVAEPFPTARFIPAREVQARVPARAFGDPLLLCIRVLAILLMGAAVAGPVPASRAAGRRVARIVVVDRSMNVASLDELRDSVRKVVRPSDQVIVVDTVARVVSGPLDPAALTTGSAPGVLSAGFARAIAVASSLAGSADSAAIIVISPFTDSEFDAATPSIRSMWPGAIGMVPVRAAVRDTVPALVQINTDSNDAVRAGLALDGLAATGVASQRDASVRLVRGSATAADSAWARDGDRRALVEWPAASPAPAGSGRATDSIVAVGSGDAVVVGLFRRPWRLSTGQVVARWIDGEPAAVELPLGRGCIREIGIAFDERSDLSLRPAFRKLARRLVAPCGGTAAGGGARTISAARLDSLRGSGHASVATRALRDDTNRVSPLAPWLLAAAALLLILEMAARRPPRRVAA